MTDSTVRADVEPALEFAPLTVERWGDLERLFGERGACGGCWCMWWRLRRSEYDRQKGEGNRRSLRALVVAGEPVGLLAYLAGEPVGWCAVAPRRAYPALARSRILAPVEGEDGDEAVWSVTCLFVARPYRRRGLTAHLLEAAVVHARDRGARVVEGYPIEPRQPAMPPVFAATGIASAFRRAGFTEVLRRSETRPIMRRVL